MKKSLEQTAILTEKAVIDVLKSKPITNDRIKKVATKYGLKPFHIKTVLGIRR